MVTSTPSRQRSTLSFQMYTANPVHICCSYSIYTVGKMKQTPRKLATRSVFTANLVLSRVNRLTFVPSTKMSRPYPSRLIEVQIFLPKCWYTSCLWVTSDHPTPCVGERLCAPINEALQWVRSHYNQVDCYNIPFAGRATKPKRRVNFSADNSSRGSVAAAPLLCYSPVWVVVLFITPQSHRRIK